MSANWIKMRCDLFTHPKVVRISSALKADVLRTVGGLMSAWCLFDAHSVDGSLPGYTAQTLDDHLRWPGFSESMKAVEWLFEDEKGLYLPRFDTHNGASAKRRAQEADRKRSVRNMSASEADEMRTREEKIREENKKKEQEQRARENAEQPEATALGLLCKAIIAGGFPATRLNQSNPQLMALVEAGVSPQEAGDATREAVAAGKCNIGYIVGTINGRRQDAAKPIAPKAQPPKPSSHAIVKPTPTTLTPEQCEANQARLKNLLGGLAA